MTDLKAGEFFTVKEWVDSRDNSYKGDCLEARVVDGDFVRVRRHRSAQSKSNFTLDIRRVEIQRLSAEFVEEVLSD